MEATLIMIVYTLGIGEKEKWIKKWKCRPLTDQQQEGRAFALNRVFFHDNLIQGRQKKWAMPRYSVRADCYRYEKREKKWIDRGVRERVFRLDYLLFFFSLWSESIHYPAGFEGQAREIVKTREQYRESVWQLPVVLIHNTQTLLWFVEGGGKTPMPY